MPGEAAPAPQALSYATQAQASGQKSSCRQSRRGSPRLSAPFSSPRWWCGWPA